MHRFVSANGENYIDGENIRIVIHINKVELLRQSRYLRHTMYAFLHVQPNEIVISSKLI